jgi:hypothetical protein
MKGYQFQTKGRSFSPFSAKKPGAEEKWLGLLKKHRSSPIYVGRSGLSSCRPDMEPIASQDIIFICGTFR